MVGIVISANQDFPFAFSPSNSSLISRACSSVSPTAGRPSSNLAGPRACLSQTIPPVDPPHKIARQLSHFPFFSPGHTATSLLLS